MRFNTTGKVLESYESLDTNGNRYMSLKDLKGPIYVSFSQLGDNILDGFLAHTDFYDRKDENCLKSYLRGSNDTIPVSILNRMLERYEELEEEQLESHISSIKSGKSGISIEVESLPLDLCTENWGFIFGMLPDVRVDGYDLGIDSKRLAETVVGHLNEAGIDTQVRDGKRRPQVVGGSMLGRIVYKSGFASEERQVRENVSFPEWVFRAENEEFHRSLIAGILESEGSSPTSSTRSCRITQAHSIDGIEDLNCEVREEKTPSGNKVRRAFFSNLPNGKKEVVKNSPPPLLLSVKRLLNQYNIQSSLNPESVTMTEKTTAALWNLCVSGEDIKQLYIFCQDYLVSKDDTFNRYIENKEEWHRDKGTRFESYLRDIEYLYEKNRYVTSKMLAEYADRAEKTTSNTISILENKGLIECEGYKDRYKCWRPVEKGY